MDAAVTLSPSYEGVDLRGLDIKAGDILFLVPAGGRYCHIAEDGLLRQWRDPAHSGTMLSVSSDGS